MAFNKSKALESALKFLNQGKVAQAIGEYQQILRHDPKDQATLMTVGDLFARQGDMPQAIEYFERLAQVYLNEGFNSSDRDLQEDRQACSGRTRASRAAGGPVRPAGGAERGAAAVSANCGSTPEGQPRAESRGSAAAAARRGAG